MKKTYLKPQTESLTINTRERMLAGSVQGSVKEDSWTNEGEEELY